MELIMKFNYQLVTEWTMKFNFPQIAHKNSILCKNNRFQTAMLRVPIKRPFA
jgi:hypothetical protein